jgi:uncharacterized protein
MSLYAIADLHLSLGTDKPMDVFKGWENYTEKIRNNWLKIITEDDTVVIAGDVSWSMSLANLCDDFQFINALPGKKLIIKGNHDYWWDTMSKMNSFLKKNEFDTIRIIHNSAEKVEGVEGIAVCGTRGWFYDADGDKKILLREAGRLETSIKIAEASGLEPIVFLHYPPYCAGYCCIEIMDVLKAYHVRRCYFGHLHGRAASVAFEGEHDGINFRLISCDHTGFVPVIIQK